MGFELIQLILIVSGATAAAIGFMEMRLQNMYTRIQEKIADKNEINRIVQESLKEDILRLETKIDMLLQLNIDDSKRKLNGNHP